MSEQAKISIIVPVYNEEDYLPLLLNSLKKQTLQPNEIIICDNNSTDNSIKIAKSYQDSLPIKIIHQKEKGIIPTLEKAWRSAKHEIIIRTDADSILPKKYLENCYRYLNKYPKVSALTGPLISTEFHLILSPIHFLSANITNLLLSIIRGYPLITGPNGVFRKSILKKVDGYKNTTNQHQLDDHLITKKIHTISGKIAFTPRAYNYHSIRRWVDNPFGIIRSLLVVFNTSFYKEKSS